MLESPGCVLQQSWATGLPGIPRLNASRRPTAHQAWQRFRVCWAYSPGLGAEVGISVFIPNAPKELRGQAQRVGRAQSSPGQGGDPGLWGVAWRG